MIFTSVRVDLKGYSLMTFEYNSIISTDVLTSFCFLKKTCLLLNHLICIPNFLRVVVIYGIF